MASAVAKRQASQIALYETARKALAKARTVDEVKKVRDGAERMKLWARQAKDHELLADAVEIRLRAERRLGEMLKSAKDARQISRGGKGAGGDKRVRLEDVGIDRKLSAKAQRVAGVPEKMFTQLVRETRERIAAGGAAIVDPMSVLSTEEKQQRRDVKERLLGESQSTLPSKRYGVILADPEWRYEPRSRKTGLNRAADNHYLTSPLPIIQSRDVPSIAAKDCVLAMWAIVPMLAEAFCVLDAWGFGLFVRDPATGFLSIDKSAGRYVSSGAWVKYKPGARIGTGHWFRVDHEILLIATRGSPPAPAKGKQFRSVFDVPASRVHSRKPQLVHEIIEAYYPTLPKIELNLVGKPRKGWAGWGNQAVAA